MIKIARDRKETELRDAATKMKKEIKASADGLGKSLADFAVCPGVSVIISDEPEKASMPVKMQLALYIGGMGARDKNCLLYTSPSPRDRS